jgi:hypothetical protein
MIFLFQLINAMERVANNNNLIGFSCGHQFVMTPMIVFKINLIKTFDIFFFIAFQFLISKFELKIDSILYMFIIFGRFILLTHKFAN